MSSAHTPTPLYILGHAEGERQRLIAQSRIYGPFTEKLLAAAGIAKGMRVLDIGCGVGDVSLLAARMVGPEGFVVGVDREAVAVTAARERAESQQLTNLTFQSGDPCELHTEQPFDALIGRFVLMYQKDPQATLCRLAEKVKQGGIVAFHELDFTDPPGISENLAWRQCFYWWRETAVRAGIEVHMGLKLYSAFIGARLPAPTFEMFTPVGGGPDFAGYDYVAESIRSIIPLMEQFGVASATEVNMATLAERLRADTLTANAVIILPHTVGAWTRKA